MKFFRGELADSTPDLLKLTQDELDVAVKVTRLAMEHCASKANQNMQAHGITSKEFQRPWAWAEHLCGSLEFLQKLQECWK